MRFILLVGPHRLHLLCLVFEEQLHQREGWEPRSGPQQHKNARRGSYCLKARGVTVPT